ncbi:sugar transporter [Fusarium albosuccineum]|uniref:Sugar transporter n=1 Tax=Fusarium albosuccineum TaxID=1237068 RepID=A0A8H4LLB4_9HYPO|nr:sugar transporter [Fusarium albosuccineum]
MGRGVFAGKAAFAQATPRLMIFCTIYALGSIFFGYDGASFGGVQAMDPFMKTFGKWNETKEAYYLPSDLQSLMNSLPLIGKFLGTIIVGPIIERLSVPSVVPTYQSEVAPGALRGFFVGSVQLCLTTGSLIAGIVSESMSRKTNNSGWQIATALQALPAVMILCLLFFTPNSPRWLIFNDRYEEALKVLRSVRRQQDVDNGLPELELASMREEGRAGKREKGPWKNLINRENRRRTGIACAIMTFQQLTGVTFSSSYGPTFYRSVGLTDMAFIYAVVNNATSVVTAMMAMVFLDMFGRRTLVVHGGWSQGAFLISIAALGRIKNPNVNESNGIVAGMQLYTCILHMTLGPGAYITAAEVGTQALRAKTMAVSTALNVLVGFVVVFCTPYLLREIGSGLAYIWGGFAILSSIWAWFFMPELKGRNLEEIDQLFEANIPARKFSKYQTGGLTHELAVLENGETIGKKVDEEADIDVSRVENARP